VQRRQFDLPPGLGDRGGEFHPLTLSPHQPKDPLPTSPFARGRSQCVLRRQFDLPPGLGDRGGEYHSSPFPIPTSHFPLPTSHFPLPTYLDWKSVRDHWQGLQAQARCVQDRISDRGCDRDNRSLAGAGGWQILSIQ